MKRTPIYSRSARRQRSRDAFADDVSRAAGNRPAAPAPAAGASEEKAAPFLRAHLTGARAFVARHALALPVLSAALLVVLAFLAYILAATPAPALNQKDIDAAVLRTLRNTVLPSQEVRAFQKIRPSVVRVAQEADDNVRDKLRGVGTGVVVIGNGTILTSLHVIEGSGIHLRVRFANGFETGAVVLARQPENDLAVIRALAVPDDVVPATLRSSRGLATGERVVAVGYPFNIGPSASSGIISGLKRTYVSPDEATVLKDLIQFDAAANPGNSGGPLITMDGEVVGIVSAILSPHEQGTFIGIGFAVPIETAASAAGEAPF